MCWSEEFLKNVTGAVGEANRSEIFHRDGFSTFPTSSVDSTWIIVIQRGTRKAFVKLYHESGWRRWQRSGCCWLLMFMRQQGWNSICFVLHYLFFNNLNVFCFTNHSHIQTPTRIHRQLIFASPARIIKQITFGQNERINAREREAFQASFESRVRMIWIIFDWSICKEVFKGTERSCQLFGGFYFKT